MKVIIESNFNTYTGVGFLSLFVVALASTVMYIESLKVQGALATVPGVLLSWFFSLLCSGIAYFSLKHQHKLPDTIHSPYKVLRCFKWLQTYKKMVVSAESKRIFCSLVAFFVIWAGVIIQIALIYKFQFTFFPSVQADPVSSFCVLRMDKCTDKNLSYSGYTFYSLQSL
jgi:hypothetical protein